jgi:hypothetical protein
MVTRILVGPALALSFLTLLAPANAQAHVQDYAMAGTDSFRIAARELQTQIEYAGDQRLTIVRTGSVTHFTAAAAYVRREGGTAAHATGTFASTILPSGEQRDDGNADPDYLTILNQPFSIQLDAPTLRDLRSLAGAVPFDFPSPMTGTPLHGSLRRLLDRTFNGVRVLGIAFSAHGPLAGTLPDRPTLAVSGTITMNGTAYYAYTNALLLALDATLLIEGKVGGPTASDTVTIRYKRSIRPAPVERRGR